MRVRFHRPQAISFVGILSIFLLLVLVLPGAQPQPAQSQSDGAPDTLDGHPIWDEVVTSFLGEPGVSDTTLNDFGLHEGYLGWDEESNQRLSNPAIHVGQEPDSIIAALIAEKAAQLDSGRLIYRSGYEQAITQGLDAAWLAEMEATASGVGEYFVYSVIQFPLPFDLAARAELEQANVHFYNYVRGGGLYARVPTSALTTVQSLAAEGRVLYAGPIPVAAKLDPILSASMQDTPDTRVEITVQLFDLPDPAQLAQIETILEITDTSLHPVLPLLAGELPASDALLLANLPYVRWLEENVPHTLHNLESTMALSTDVLNHHSNNATGAGIRVAVMDTGIANPYHGDLPSNRVIDQREYYPGSGNLAIDVNGHGTHVAGTAGGSGVGSVDRWLRGHAPGARFLIYKLCCNSQGTGFPNTGFQNSLIRASSNGMHISNNSWGGGSGIYGTSAEIADRAVRGEYGRRATLLVAAGNSNALVSSPGTAKNVITAGAVKDGNWQWSSNQPPLCGTALNFNWPPGQRACFSNFGPIDIDGDNRVRIKPDVVATGVGVRSPVPGNGYATYMGTSMAAPAVTGAIAASLEHYSSQGITWLLNWPETVKALIMATAIDVGGDTRYYGRGQLNAFNTTFFQPGITGPGQFMGNVIQSTNQPINFTFPVPTNYHYVRVVLTWSDPAGAIEVANDLDLYVYSNSTCTGQPVGIANSWDDTVEFVQVSSGRPSGTWCAQVRAFSLSSPNQRFGLATYPVIKGPSLQISSSASAAHAAPGSSFFFYTTASNSGVGAGGNYIRTAIPSGLRLLGARVYTRDGRSHYYNSSDLFFSGGYWRVATGEIISGSPRLVRWFVQVEGTTPPGTYQLYANAYHRDRGNLVASTNSNHALINVPGVYLPIVNKGE